MRYANHLFPSFCHPCIPHNLKFIVLDEHIPELSSSDLRECTGSVVLVAGVVCLVNLGGGGLAGGDWILLEFSASLLHYREPYTEW